MTNTITAGQTLQTRSIGNSEIIYSVEVIDRKKSFATVMTDEGVKRCKVYTSPFDGREFIMPFGKYSMAPTFRA